MVRELNCCRLLKTSSVPSKLSKPHMGHSPPSPAMSDRKAQDKVGLGILQEGYVREKWVLLLVDGTQPSMP